MKAIAELLQHTMGLQATTIGPAAVDRAIADRMARVGALSADSYLARLQSDPAELEELIEEVVVPESWFFRDGAPFATLKRWVVEQWLPSHPFETLRVLTVPCSTGEEPYSVAMALFDAGLPPGRFAVQAVDISRRALARAREGVYRINSFRGKALDFRDQYFEYQPDGGYALAPAVRRQVTFGQGNLLSTGFLIPGGAHYDVIFCRNLLIYFDRPTQARAVRALNNLLLRDGLLFVGHAETGALSGMGFVPTDHSMSFAFRKAQPTVLAPPKPTARVWKTTRIMPADPVRQPTRTALMPPPSLARFAPVVRTGAMPLKSPPPPPSSTAPPTLPAGSIPAPANAEYDRLKEARRLADAGRLQEAAGLCETHLREQGASASAWYLLGVVRDAAGERTKAAECFSKTLYLDPSHEDALLQRALLAEGAGDTATAARLRSRIVRVQERSKRPS